MWKMNFFIAAFLKFFLRIKENFFKGNLEGTLLELSIEVEDVNG